MDAAKRRNRHGWGGLASCLIAALLGCGCQTVRTPEEQIAASDVGRELSKVTLPTHVIEPPDILIVEVLEALPGRPIEGEHLVRPDGTISLGFYGDVYVTGMTLTEAKEKIIIHLRKHLNDEVLGLWGPADEEGGKPKQIPPAESDRVFVDVAAYNSKFYYVQGDVGEPGRLPILGNETVLDAINYAGGLIPTAAPQNIRVVRPAPPGASCQQVLPVNLAAIVNGGDTTTNYQLLPGDRVVVYRDPIVRSTIFLERLAAPFQIVLGNMQTYSFARQSIRYLGAPLPGLSQTQGGVGNNQNLSPVQTGVTNGLLNNSGAR